MMNLGVLPDTTASPGRGLVEVPARMSTTVECSIASSNVVSSKTPDVTSPSTWRGALKAASSSRTSDVYGVMEASRRRFKPRYTIL